VGIAIEYALRIAAKLAALVASGQNLMKLVQGGMAVVDLINQALSSISQQSIRADAEPQPSGGGAEQQQGADPASTMSAGDSGDTGAPASSAGSAPMSSAGGFGGGGVSTPGGSAVPSAAPLGVAAQSTGAIPLSHGTMPDTARNPGHASGSGASAAHPVGSVPLGAARAGAGRGGADVVRSDGKPRPARTSESGGAAQGGVPLGGLGGARAAGAKDKEHQRKYDVVEQHEEDLQAVLPVITSGRNRSLP
jgi:hypothetical protein